MFNFGTSKSGSSQTSKPISAGDVSNYFREAYRMAGAQPSGEVPDYQYRMLGGETGGDYDRLEQQIAATPTRRLQEDLALNQGRFSADMRKKGMADDPAYYQLMNETLLTPYTRAMSDAYSNAANTRYGIQEQELQGLNQGQLEYDKWAYQAPKDYWLAKMENYYRGMGQESTGSSKASSFNFGIGM